MVEVELNSDDIGKILKWYTRIYGNSEKAPEDEEVRLLSKLETMRDAILEIEAEYKD